METNLRLGLEKIREGQEIIFRNLSFEKQLAEMKRRAYDFYEVFNVPLTAAQNQEKITKGGRVFYLNRVINSSGVDVTGSIEVKFNSTKNKAITLQAGQGVVTPFEMFFITNAANLGAIAEIIICEDYELFRIIDNRLATNITTISSLGAITGEIAGLTGLPSSATKVSAQGDCSNTATALDLYTVTAAKSLYLCNSSFKIQHAAAAGIGTNFHTRVSTAGAVYHRLNRSVSNGVAYGFNHDALYKPPLIVPETYVVQLQSAALDYSSVTINGYEV